MIRSELGPFAANLLVPAFRRAHHRRSAPEGEPLHLCVCRDRRFGYPSSDLPHWLEHKTAGAIPAASVTRLKPADSLAELETGQWAVLDASSPNDLDVIAERVIAELAKGRKHLCQSAASLLNGLSGMQSVLLKPAEVPPIAAPGLVGSMCRSPMPSSGSRAPGRRVEFGLMVFIVCVTASLCSLTGVTPVPSAAARTACQPSAAKGVGSADVPGGDGPCRSGYVIAKGGTTSLTFLQQGLQLQQVRLLGQLLPGLSLVHPAVPHPRFGRLPVVTFPGNLGEASTLSHCWQLLEAVRR